MAKTNAIRAARAFVELFADDSELVRGLRKAESKVKAFGARVNEIGMGLTKAAGAILAPMTLSARVFVGFDDQMRAVQATIGATGVEFDMLNEKAKLLGRTTSFTAAQVAAGMLELGRAGFAPKEIDDAIASVLNLARATGTNLAESANIAASTLRAFGLSADETDRVADVLTATANNSAQTLTDLGEAMKHAAPVADAYGLSLEDTSKAIGTLANFSIRGSQAGTTLRNIMLQLVKGDVQAKLKAMGVEVADSAGNMRDLSTVLQEIGIAASKLPQVKQLALFDELFGKRAVPGGIKLTTESFERLNDAVDNSAGAAAKTASIMDSSIGGAMRRLLSAVEGVAIAIGESIAPHIEKIADWLSSVSLHIAEFVKRNQGLVVALGKVAAVLGVTGVALVAIGSTAKIVGISIGGLIGIFKGAALAAKVFGSALTFLVAHPVVAAIAALTVVVGALYLAFRKTQNAVVDNSKALQEYVDQARKAQAAGEQQRRTAVAMAKDLDNLAKNQRLTNAEIEAAKSIISTLESQYGPLGVAIDKTTSKITGLAEAQAKLNDAMRDQATKEIQKEVGELAMQIVKAESELSGLYARREDVRGDRGRNVAGAGIVGVVVSELAEGHVDKEIQDLIDKIAELRESYTKALGRMREAGGKDRFETTATGSVEEAVTAGNVQRSVLEDLARLRIEGIEDAAVRESKLIKLAYKNRMDEAREQIQNEADLRATLGALEQAQQIELARIEEKRIADLAAAEKKRLAEKQAMAEDVEDAMWAFALDGHLLRMKQIELEEQRAIDAARAEGKSIEDVRELYKWKRADAEADYQRQIEDANKSQAQTISELELRTKYTGPELEKRLLDLQEKQAIEAAEESGVDVDLVKREYELRRQLADMGSHTLATAGTFSGAAAERLGSAGPADRTANATEEIARNTKRMLDEMRTGGAAFE